MIKDKGLGKMEVTTYPGAHKCFFLLIKSSSSCCVLSPFRFDPLM